MSLLRHSVRAKPLATLSWHQECVLRGASVTPACMKSPRKTQRTTGLQPEAACRRRSVY